MLDDDNGASPVTEKQSAKDRTRALIKNFENWRLAIREGYSGKNNMEDTLLEIEADTDILNGLFKPTEPENKDGQQKENNVNNMEQTFEELNKMFDELEIKYSH